MNEENGQNGERKCPRCGSNHVFRDGRKPKQKDGKIVYMQQYKCLDCKKRYVRGNYGRETIEHFGVKLFADKRHKITRESFSEPCDKISYAHRKYLKQMIDEGKVTIPDGIYKDESHYTQEHVNDFAEALRKNYDINMRYFDSLDENDFQAYVEEFVSKNKMARINDLSEVDGVQGVYMMVLGKYKQVYIGISNDIKRRIKAHWQGNKNFDRRLFGPPENSILPIDSFGALDTTEIYFKKSNEWDINSLEEKLVDRFKDKYLLNRVMGGVNGEDDAAYRMVMLGGSARFRY